MKLAQQCPSCGMTLRSEVVGGLCPQCLLNCLLADADDARPTDISASGICQFGDYELLEKIGQGGMGIVYKARQISLDRVVAIKMILTGSQATEEEIVRFDREAKVAAKLKHKNIVPIYEVGVHQGQHYYVMEYVAGTNLASLARENPLPIRKAAQYIKIVAEAMHYAHQNQVLHRDLKPSNVLIDGDDQPRITDFGLSKRLDVNSDDSLNHVLGSPPYMPPEQIDNQPGAVGPHSDVYSLGSTLYRLITGKPPFQGEPCVVLEQLRNKEPIRPRLLNPGVPRDMETICLKCLEKEPRCRYVTCQELADDLGRWLEHRPIRARRAGLLLRVNRWVRRNPWASAFTASCMLGLGSILWFAATLLDTKAQARGANSVLDQFRDKGITPVRDRLQKLWSTTNNTVLLNSWELLALSLEVIPENEFTHYFPDRPDRYGDPLTLTFAAYVHESPEKEAKEYAPLLKCLERDMSRRLFREVSIDLLSCRDEDKGREALALGDVDIMRLGAVNYFLAAEVNTNLVALVETVNEGKEAVFVTRQNTGINSWSEIKGKRVGLGDTNSTMAVQAFHSLHRHGINITNTEITFVQDADMKRPSGLTDGLRTNRFDVIAMGFKHMFIVYSTDFVMIPDVEFNCARNLWIGQTNRKPEIATAFIHAMEALPHYKWMEYTRDKPTGFRKVDTNALEEVRESLEFYRKHYRP
jgi:serine/threonine protein kinase